MKNTTRQPAQLILKDGTVFTGFAFGDAHSVAGETVFSTGMVGYPESLTDPSYRGQLLVFTYPLIGNYGVGMLSSRRDTPQADFESDRIHAGGLVVSSLTRTPSHYRSRQTLDQWLKKEKVVGIEGIDTRALTTHLREHGSLLGKIVVNTPIEWYDPNREALVEQVSVQAPVRYHGKGKRIVVVDCGVKHGILRSLLNRSCDVLRVPWNYPFASLPHIDGVVISNGPGDPQKVSETIGEIKKALHGKLPMLGICLGHQLIALALGARTYKLPYGHRSHNQPVLDVQTEKAYITSQNHGYAVRESTLPQTVQSWFRNLNDGTNEGLRHRSLPVMTVQFHPEASPGPTDTAFVFDEFIKMVYARPR